MVKIYVQFDMNLEGPNNVVRDSTDKSNNVKGWFNKQSHVN